LKHLTEQTEDNMFFIILLLTFILIHIVSKKRITPEEQHDTLLGAPTAQPESKTAREAYQDYHDKYANPDGSRRYNRASFRLVNDEVVFLNNNTYTSAHVNQEELETLAPDTEVFVMVVATSSHYGYSSYINKQAKKPITLVFRAEPFQTTGIWGRGFNSSWRIDGENYHVLDAHFIKLKNLSTFEEQATEGYDFNEKY
jgi:hypothetical protein